MLDISTNIPKIFFLLLQIQGHSACIYFFKKLHKVPHKVRPIVSGSSGATEHTSAFLDTTLQPIVTSLPSHTKDSTHIVSLLSEITLPPNVTLVTIDVTSLYTTVLQEGNFSLFELYSK